MLGYLQLMRIPNCLMTVVAVFIGALVVTGLGIDIFSVALWSAMLAAFLITGAGNAINDYVDVDSDKVNRPGRPIPSGRVSRKSALIFSISLFVIGIVMAGSQYLNYVTFAIAIINTVMLIIYSFFIQNKILIGNVAVSYLVGSSFLFGGAAMGNFLLPFLLFLLAFLANLSREIVKDLQDIEGDKQGFLKKLASKFKKTITPIAERFGITQKGVSIKYEKRLIGLSQFTLILAIIISPLPYILNLLSWVYLLVLIPTNIIFLASVFFLSNVKKRKSYGRISRLIKLGMFFGLIAFIVGAVF